MLRCWFQLRRLAADEECLLCSGAPQLDLVTFLRACLYDMEDAEQQAQAAYQKLAEDEIAKFEDLMLLTSSDLAELGLGQHITARLGVMIQILKGLAPAQCKRPVFSAHFSGSCRGESGRDGEVVLHSRQNGQQSTGP